jgi:hypothetical protein
MGVYGLPAAETAVIRTIVQLYASDLSFPWKFVTAPPYDALLVDESATATERAGFARMAGSLLTLTRRNSGGHAHTLERPIRADRLQQWLKSTERTLLAAQPEPMVPKIEVSEAVRFTLRRWPSALLLRNDPEKVRMASLLARRALSATELSDLGELPLSRCVTFLQTLRSAGVLELHVVPSSARPHADLPRAPGLSAPVRGAFARSLISGIRRHLGLGAP